MHGRDDLNMLWPNMFRNGKVRYCPQKNLFVLKKATTLAGLTVNYDQLQQKECACTRIWRRWKKNLRDNSVQNPLIGFPAHWAPNDLLFYEGDQFPEHHKHGAFIAFHGSTNRSPYPQAGYFVCFIPFKMASLPAIGKSLPMALPALIQL